MSGWTPQNKGAASATNADYRYYGAATAEFITVYGEKTEDEEGNAVEPQSRRRINKDNIRAILNGDLQPLPGRKHLEVTSLGAEDSPFRDVYLEVCEELEVDPVAPFATA